jgi:hypothetical protein
LQSFEHDIILRREPLLRAIVAIKPWAFAALTIITIEARTLRTIAVTTCTIVTIKPWAFAALTIITVVARTLAA